MPELPEVETLRRQLETHLLGEIVQTIDVYTPSVIRGITHNLPKSRVSSVRRFSKLVVIDFSNNESLAVHLKMTGRLIVKKVGSFTDFTKWEIDYEQDKHTHMLIRFLSGAHLYFHDYRRFGTIDIVPSAQVLKLPYVASLGKEFFSSLTEQDFINIVGKSKKSIKSILLDQTQVAGVGNIYANEGLWEAQIHPEIPGKLLTVTQRKRLFHAIEQVMKEALVNKGASSDNFRDIFEQKGTAQNFFAVYGKIEASCPRCNSLLQKYFLAGRGTYICPHCQRIN